MTVLQSFRKSGAELEFGLIPLSSILFKICVYLLGSARSWLWHVGSLVVACGT